MQVATSAQLQYLFEWLQNRNTLFYSPILLAWKIFVVKIALEFDIRTHFFKYNLFSLKFILYFYDLNWFLIRFLRSTLIFNSLLKKNDSFLWANDPYLELWTGLWLLCTALLLSAINLYTKFHLYLLSILLDMARPSTD